ncbi:MAG: hypothetical protein MK212_17280 [Saprospiraceae bacterium]|nr:hypothetical protein [Saprospiraceae bacterium]
MKNLIILFACFLSTTLFAQIGYKTSKSISQSFPMDNASHIVINIDTSNTQFLFQQTEGKELEINVDVKSTHPSSKLLAMLVAQGRYHTQMEIDPASGNAVLSLKNKRAPIIVNSTRVHERVTYIIKMPKYKSCTFLIPDVDPAVEMWANTKYK